MSRPPRHILVVATGSIALLALPELLGRLRGGGAEHLSLVMTRTAEQIVPASTLGHLCESTCTDGDHGPGHVALARAADIAVIVPATANAIGCLAHGLAPSLAMTVVLAAHCPRIVVPSMNEAMYIQPAVRRNLERLRDDGFTVVEPAPGMTFEVASRGYVPGIAMPSPAELAEHIMGVPTCS